MKVFKVLGGAYKAIKIAVLLTIVVAIISCIVIWHNFKTGKYDDVIRDKVAEKISDVTGLDVDADKIRDVQDGISNVKDTASEWVDITSGYVQDKLGSFSGEGASNRDVRKNKQMLKQAIKLYKNDIDSYADKKDALCFVISNVLDVECNYDEALEMWMIVLDNCGISYSDKEDALRIFEDMSE